MALCWELSRVLTSPFSNLDPEPLGIHPERCPVGWTRGVLVEHEPYRVLNSGGHGHGLPLNQALANRTLSRLTPSSFPLRTIPNSNNVTNFSSLMNFKVF